MVRSRSAAEPGEPTRLEGARSPPKGASPAPGLLADPDDAHRSAPSGSRFTSPLPAELLLEAERPFGRYLLLRRLAFGGMGEILLARPGGAGSHAPGAKLVVIKRLLSHMRHDDKNRKMFLDEARLQALLTNPHIVAIHDVGEANGHVYLAMEHVHGPSWRELIDRARQKREHIALAHIASLVAQAARGLSYAHNLVDVTGASLHVVHRDVNPHNLLVNYQGEVKLIDFGIAKSDLVEGQTETGTIKGKFSYMSPEQSAALPLDHRSDMFALGICLFELLTLENPFRKANVVLSLESIQRDTPAPLERRRRGAGIFQTIIDRCLAKEREDRFDDCGAIARILEGMLNHGVVAAPDQSLSSWLSTVFADEIAAHVAVLERSGLERSGLEHSGPQGGGAVRSDDDESSRPRVPSPAAEEQSSWGSHPGRVPSADRMDTVLHDQLPDTTMFEPELGDQVALTVSMVAVLPVATELASPAVTERSVTNESHIQTVNRVMPQRRARGPLLALAAVAVGALLLLLVLERALEHEHVAIVPPEDPPPLLPTPPAPMAIVTTAPPTVDRTPDKQPLKVSRTRLPGQPARPLAGTLLVTSEGHQVKGNRRLAVGAATTLVVVDGGAPYRVKLVARADDAGEVTFDVDSEPWSIVRIDGLSKGRSPQRGLALAAGKSVNIDLSNPKAGAMRLTLIFNAAAVPR